MQLNGKNSHLAKALHTKLRQLRAGHGAACAAAVVYQNDLLAECAVGTTGDGKKPASVNDLYDIGSITKVYTALAVVRLVQKGKLNLDDPVVKYLPNFKTSDPRSDQITVKMLLNHSSGLPGTNLRGSITSGVLNQNYDQENDHYWKMAKLKADPGAFSVYCNEGFTLAATLVEQVSGMNFMAFLRQEFFEPLGLKSFELADHPAGVEHPLHLLNSQEEYIFVAGAGAMRCTMADNAFFGAAFLHPGVISSEEIKLMTTPAGVTFLAHDQMSPNYGLGWDSVGPDSVLKLGPKVFHKGGGTLHFGSYLLVVPKYDLVLSFSTTLDTELNPVATAYELLNIVGQELSLDLVPVAFNDLAAKKLPAKFAAEYGGIYYGGDTIYRAVFKNEKLQVEQYAATGWQQVAALTGLNYDGASFVGPKNRIFFEKHGQAVYLLRNNLANGLGLVPIGKKFLTVEALPQAWRNRLGTVYVTCDLNPACLSSGQACGGPFLAKLATFGDGKVVFFTTNSGALTAKPCSDSATTYCLDAPGMGSRESWAPSFKQAGESEVLQLWNYQLLPVDQLPSLQAGQVKLAAYQNAVFATHAGQQLIGKLPKGIYAATISADGKEAATFYPETRPRLVDGYVIFVSQEEKIFTVEFAGKEPGV